MGTVVGTLKRKCFIVHRDAHRVRQRLIDAWTTAIHGLRQMNQACSVSPDNGFEVIRLDSSAPSDVVKFDVGPVVFNLPEKATHRSPNLFIVMQGWLTIEGNELKKSSLLTKDFGTEIGYFRLKQRNLEHVYGAHFDMDEKGPGHPVFHVQFGSQPLFGPIVHSAFKRDEEVIDRISGVLGNVRTPSAQMDIFSVITQICADHLIWRDSAAEAKKAFIDVRRTGSFLVGAAHRLAFLNNAHASNCYRGSHWYEAPAANTL